MQRTAKNIVPAIKLPVTSTKITINAGPENPPISATQKNIPPAAPIIIRPMKRGGIKDGINKRAGIPDAMGIDAAKPACEGGIPFSSNIFGSQLEKTMVDCKREKRHDQENLYVANRSCADHSGWV